uniref:TSA: Wollemia nobilis Ref_Wollemi_Transcript_12074_1311 transcribed RNA sequence n=1 Tax=Wollemia nobilis TaxID=56998 RepID=A0A0C9QSB8_9CONI
METGFKPFSFTWAFCLLGMSMLWTAQKSFANVVNDGLLPNGDFEASPEATSLNGTVISGDTSLPSWKTKGMVEYIRAGQAQGPMVLVVPQGKHAARLGNDAQISQEIELEKGSVYSLTFSAARTCAQLESLNVSVPPAAGTLDLQTLYNSEGWDSYAWGFRADADKSEVVFLNPGLEDDPTCGPLIDAVAIKKTPQPDHSDENLVTNGDFEEGPYMFSKSSLGVLLPPNLDAATSPLPSWTVESSKAVRYVDSSHFDVPEGKRALQLLSGNEGSVSQTIKTVTGKSYTLRFLLGDGGDGCHKPLAVMAFAGDRSRAANYSSEISDSYQEFNLTFTAKSESTRIVFYSLYYNTRTVDNSSLCGPVIDDVKVIDSEEVSEGSAVRLSGSLVFSALLITFVFV